MNNLSVLPVNSRVVMASLWVVMLFVYAYVDIFGLFRADILQNALEGKVFVFEANQLFFFLTTIYILIPSSMVYLTLVLKPSFAKILNLVIPALYIFTIAGSMVGETWMYYLLGSVVEIAVLVVLMFHAWKWPHEDHVIS
jgi:hypothetical protein